jgi:transposase-like protein
MSLELTDVQNINRVNDEPDEVIIWQPVPHVRRQKERLITQHRTKRLRHKQILPSCHHHTAPRHAFCDRLYDIEIRRVLSTNAIESLNARYRRAIKARGHFPTEQAALKCLYLVTRSLDPTGTGQPRWTMRWKPALNAFAITFSDRFPPAETY